MTDIITEKTEKKLPSLDEFLAMSRDTRLEIIDGVTVEMTAGGMTNGILGGILITYLNLYLFEHPIGVAAQDNVTYLMYSVERRLKNSFVPDVSFVYHENIPANWNSDTPHPGVPDLAIEIVSPHDDPAEVLRKRRIYLEKGTRQVWILYPGVEELHQYSAEGVRIYSQQDEIIDCTALFPGLTTLTLGAIFRLPAWAIKPKADDE